MISFIIIINKTMREIDDRYPEFAEAKEPVKKAKHHKGLSWSFFTAAAVALTALYALNTPSPDTPVLPPETETVVVTIDVKDREMQYSGEEYLLMPEYSYSAMEGSDDVSGYVSVTMNKDTQISVTDAGTYPFGLTPADFSVSSDRYDDIKIYVNDGQVKIDPAEITVTVSGNKATVTYDRKPHTVSGYVIRTDSDDYDGSDVVFNGSASASGTGAGITYMGLTPSQFTNTNSNYDVTFEVSDGYMQINRARVGVDITGASQTVAYDGNAHSVNWFSVSIDNENYSEDLFSFTGFASASRTAVGTSAMGLSSSQFRNLDRNFIVTFNVTDGYIRITEPEHDPPVLNFDGRVRSNVNLDMDPFAVIDFTMIPNEIMGSGGSATFYVYYQNGSGGYIRDTEYPFTYTGNGSNDEVEVTLAHRMPEENHPVRQKGKIVGEITYPDGDTATYESEEFYMYMGTFADINDDYGDEGILVSEDRVEVDIIIQGNVVFDDGGTLSVSADNVEFEFMDLYVYIKDADDNWIDELTKYREEPDVMEIITDDSGIKHMHLTFLFPEGTCPAGPYAAVPSFYSEMIETVSGWTAPVPYYFY